MAGTAGIGCRFQLKPCHRNPTAKANYQLGLATPWAPPALQHSELVMANYFIFSWISVILVFFVCCARQPLQPTMIGLSDMFVLVPVAIAFFDFLLFSVWSLSSLAVFDILYTFFLIMMIIIVVILTVSMKTTIKLVAIVMSMMMIIMLLLLLMVMMMTWWWQ